MRCSAPCVRGAADMQLQESTGGGAIAQAQRERAWGQDDEPSPPTSASLSTTGTPLESVPIRRSPKAATYNTFIYFLTLFLGTPI